jgi:hypothetical protein
MESEGSSPYSQQLATCSYPEPEQSSPCPPSYFPEIHFNITLPSTPGSSKWSPSPRFPDQNLVRISSLPHTCYMPCPSRFSWFYHQNNVCWEVQSSSFCSLGYKHFNVSKEIIKEIVSLKFVSISCQAESEPKRILPRKCGMVHSKLG